MFLLFNSSSLGALLITILQWAYTSEEFWDLHFFFQFCLKILFLSDKKHTASDYKDPYLGLFMEIIAVSCGNHITFKFISITGTEYTTLWMLCVRLIYYNMFRLTYMAETCSKWDEYVTHMVFAYWDPVINRYSRLKFMWIQNVKCQLTYVHCVGKM